MERIVAWRAKDGDEVLGDVEHFSGNPEETDQLILLLQEVWNDLGGIEPGSFELFYPKSRAELDQFMNRVARQSSSVGLG